MPEQGSALATAAREACVIEIRRILCPTDFSDISRHALEHAIVMARWYDSRLIALHVASPMVVLGTFVPVPPTASGMPPDESSLQQREEQLRAWLSPAIAAGLRTDVIVDDGNPAGCILDQARTLPADLIILGTHGQGGFERLVLGSVAEKVLRKAACPVMTVPPHVAGASKLPFAHVLCPIDFSDSSIAALQFAFSLAQESNARLTLLHVFEWPADEATAKRVFERSEFQRWWEADTRQQLEALIPADVRNWCVPDTRLAFGKAYERILSLATSDEVDLIVMGVRGRNPIDLTLFGSTTNQVVRQSSCPVLTLRH
jgi:nucleotide-binding universal stress UspA family protein